MDTSINLKVIIENHGKWLRNEKGGERCVCKFGANLSRANLRDANLSYADLSGANLSDADLSRANLSDANLSYADLRGANLSYANLSFANLSDADLRRADLRDANLRRADLSFANLSGANLRDANLSDADLSRANLSDANLSGANLRDANLSGAVGLLNPIKWMSDNFVHDDLGYIVYKATGNTDYNVPIHWTIKPNSIIEEVVNPLPTNGCGCGVNFATLSWVRENYANSVIWKCRIRWMDCVGIVVPYNTDGKARCARLELIEVVK